MKRLSVCQKMQKEKGSCGKKIHIIQMRYIASKPMKPKIFKKSVRN